MKQQLILASGSPRRKELLESLGLEFTIEISQFDEVLSKGELVSDYVRRNSYGKAKWVCEKKDLFKNDARKKYVIAADTVVCLNNTILQKPKSKNEAFRMLSMLSGQTHKVYTGVTVLKSNSRDEYQTDFSIVVDSSVSFKKLSEKEINRYIESGEPMDKAGSYGIQNLGAYFVKNIEGSYTNIKGLPLSELYEYLEKI